MVHGWYKILDWLFEGQNQEDFSTAVGKMLVDQTVFSPFFNALYFYVVGLLDGQPLSAINTKVGFFIYISCALLD